MTRPYWSQSIQTLILISSLATLQWASANDLALNLTKTKQIVFKRPRARCSHLPSAVDNIEQLDCNKLLVLFHPFQLSEYDRFA